MVIRLATLDDLDQMVDLWSELLEYHAPLHRVFELSRNVRRVGQYELRYRLLEPYTRFFVCDMGGGRLAGMTTTQYSYTSRADRHDFRGFIAETIVGEPFRGRGIGERLAAVAEEWLKALGVDYIELQVVPANERGLAFWQRQGYAAVTQHLVKFFRGHDGQTA